MDAFFASVEMRDDPRLRSNPVIVGSDPKGGKGRGVVSACSYEARKFGIHSAMPISIAYHKCPQGIFLPVDMEKYSAVSEDIYNVLRTVTPDIEPVGIDEAFLDITGSHHLFGTPADTCMLIKSRIRERTGLTASVGLAPSRIAAKVASDLRKPDGFVEVSENGVAEFLSPLDIRKLWGLGAKTEALLKGIGIYTIGQLAASSENRIVDLLGESGRGLWKLANGMDDSELVLEREAKSVSNEFTFDSDTSSEEEASGAIMELSEKVSSRLRACAIRAKTVTVKIRLAGFKTYTRSATLQSPTNITDILYNTAKELYNEFKGKKIRLLGVKASSLTERENEKDMFTEYSEKRLRDIDSSVDKIRSKFGNYSIHRASVIKR